jgi:hypothetical protein
MTPEEVRRLSVAEYLAFLRYMDEEAREMRRAAKKKGRR